LFREFAAARARTRAAFDRDTTQAYQAVAIYFKAQGDKRMPPLESLLSDARLRSGRQQTAAQQRSILKVMMAQYGWTPRNRKRPEKAEAAHGW
jgi:hypothetical protein